MCTICIANTKTHTPTTSDVYIGRGSALGNPFTSIQNRPTRASVVCASREESIASYKMWLLDKIAAKDPAVCKALNALYKQASQQPLTLVCWCAPLPCHGDVIREILLEKLQVVK